jgi:hypothetical protein
MLFKVSQQSLRWPHVPPSVMQQDGTSQAVWAWSQHSVA